MRIFAAIFPAKPRPIFNGPARAVNSRRGGLKSRRDAFQSRDGRDRFLRFRSAPHFFENVREIKIFARPIRLPGDGAALRGAGVGETVLPHPQLRDAIERFHFMHIEPSCASRKARFRFGGVSPACA